MTATCRYRPSGRLRYRFKRLYCFDWYSPEIDQAMARAKVPDANPARPTWEAAVARVLATPVAAVAPHDSLALDPWSFIYPPRAVLLDLRARIRAQLDSTNTRGEASTASVPSTTVLIRDDGTVQRAPSILYLSRADSGIRNIRNEKLLIDVMKRKYGDAAVTIFLGKGMTAPQQWAMFANADVVVAPHGAGLANLVACAPRTPVILFPMQPHVDNQFNYQAVLLNLNLIIVPRIHSYYYGSYDDLTTDSLELIMRAVETALHQAPLMPPNSHHFKMSS
jgi:hypothetical protein